MSDNQENTVVESNDGQSSLRLDELLKAREEIKASRPKVYNPGPNTLQLFRKNAGSRVECSVSTDMWDESAFDYFNKTLELEFQILKAKDPRFDDSKIEVDPPVAANNYNSGHPNTFIIGHLYQHKAQLVSAIQNVVKDMTGSLPKVDSKKIARVHINMNDILWDGEKDEDRGFKYCGLIVFREVGDPKSPKPGHIFLHHYYAIDVSIPGYGLKTSRLSERKVSGAAKEIYLDFPWDKSVHICLYNVRKFVDKVIDENQTKPVPMVDCIMWQATDDSRISHPIIGEGTSVQRHDDILNIITNTWKELSAARLDKIYYGKVFPGSPPPPSVYKVLTNDLNVIAKVSQTFGEGLEDELTEDEARSILYKLPDNTIGSAYEYQNTQKKKNTEKNQEPKPENKKKKKKDKPAVEEPLEFENDEAAPPPVENEPAPNEETQTEDEDLGLDDPQEAQEDSGNVDSGSDVADSVNEDEVPVENSQAPEEEEKVNIDYEDDNPSENG
jgi:hypothetical protein